MSGSSLEWQTPGIPRSLAGRLTTAHACAGTERLGAKAMQHSSYDGSGGALLTHACHLQALIPPP